MPSVKRRDTVEEGSSSSSFDPSRFRSHAHEQRFNNVLVKRNFVRQRGFILKENEYPDIQVQIHARSWGKLCDPLFTGSQTVVREFYANAFMASNEEDKYQSMVRGTFIEFGKDVLNEYFGIEYMGQCAYHDLLRRPLDPELVLQELCKEGAQWVLDTKGAPKFLKKTDLKTIPRIWCTFVQANLLPCSNTPEVSVKRALLVFAIVTGATVDIGRIIAFHMHMAAQETSSSLPYSSLITNLCSERGIHVIGDQPIQPTPPITALVIERYFQKDATAPTAPTTQVQGQVRRQPRQVLSIAQRLDRLERVQLQNQRKLNYIIQLLRSMAEQMHLNTNDLGGLPVIEEEIMANINFSEEDEEENDEDEEQD